MTNSTDIERMTTFRISRAWWGNFTAEAIIDDAMASDPADPNADQYLLDTRDLLERVEAHGRKTKSEIVVGLTDANLRTLASQAEWYGYYWGEEMARDAWDIGERGAWAARGRSSWALHRKATAALDS